MTDRRRDPSDVHVLAGAHALDALEGEERERFERHLQTCHSCAQEVAAFHAATAKVGDLTADPPPPDLRQRVLDEIARTDQVVDAPASVTELSGRRTMPRWAIGAAAAVAAALVVAVAGLAVVVGDLSGRLSDAEVAAEQLEEVLAAPDATTVTAEGPEGSLGRVVASGARGEAVFVSSGLASAPDEHTYELWLIDDTGATSAGLFDPVDGRATELLAGDIAGTAAIGVTVEPAGGSSEPTTDPVMVFELG